MANAGSAGFRLYMNGETTWGTPVAAGGTAFRVTGGISKTATETTMSREVTNYENTDVVRTRLQGGGSYNFEMSFPATVDKEFDLLLQSIMGGAFSSDIMKVGSTRKAITFEEKFGDITQFIAYAGGIVESIRIDVRPGDMITGSFNFISKKGAVSGTSVFTTPAAANTNAVMNPMDSIQTLNWNGSPVPGVTGFSMELRRPVVQFPQISNTDPADLQMGSFEASGSISLYVVDSTYLADYLAFTERALAFKMGESTVRNYLFNFAKVNMTDGGIESIGKDSPVIQTFNWAAKLDATDSTLKITRDVTP